MLNATFRPLTQWPGQRTKSRRDATFRATYPKTLDELERELNKLGTREIVIQVEQLTRADIRNDGWPRVGKRQWFQTEAGGFFLDQISYRDLGEAWRQIHEDRILPGGNEP